MLLCLLSLLHLLAEFLLLTSNSKLTFSVLSCCLDIASLLGTLDVLLMCLLTSLAISRLVRFTDSLAEENMVSITGFATLLDFVCRTDQGRPQECVYKLAKRDGEKTSHDARLLSCTHCRVDIGPRGGWMALSLPGILNVHTTCRSDATQWKPEYLHISWSVARHPFIYRFSYLLRDYQLVLQFVSSLQ